LSKLTGFTPEDLEMEAILAQKIEHVQNELLAINAAFLAVRLHDAAAVITRHVADLDALHAAATSHGLLTLAGSSRVSGV
jgi:hypothetical protein